jgi:hypothetical protein
MGAYGVTESIEGHGSRAARFVSALGAGLLLGGALAAFAPAPAQACGGVACSEGSFYLAQGSKLPANTRALLWRPPRDYRQTGSVATELHLSRVDGAEPVELAIALEDQPSGDVVVRLMDSLAPAARYRLSVMGPVECLPKPVEFESGPEAPLPRMLGRAQVSAPAQGEMQVATNSGTCDTLLPAVIADADLELAPEAEPWAPLLRFAAQVDAKPWTPSWSLIAGDAESGASTRVFAECDRPLASGQPIDRGAYHEGLAEGEHGLRWTATLPGVDLTLMSQEARFELDCEPGSSAGDAGRAGGAAGRTATAGRTAPAPATADAGTIAGGSSGGFHDDLVRNTGIPHEDEGCAVTRAGTGGPRSALAPAALLLLGLLLAARRRAR